MAPTPKKSRRERERLDRNRILYYDRSHSSLFWGSQFQRTALLVKKGNVENPYLTTQVFEACIAICEKMEVREVW